MLLGQLCLIARLGDATWATIGGLYRFNYAESLHTLTK